MTPKPYRLIVRLQRISFTINCYPRYETIDDYSTVEREFVYTVTAVFRKIVNTSLSSSTETSDIRATYRFRHVTRRYGTTNFVNPRTFMTIYRIRDTNAFKIP